MMRVTMVPNRCGMISARAAACSGAASNSTISRVLDDTLAKARLGLAVLFVHRPFELVSNARGANALALALFEHGVVPRQWLRGHFLNFLVEMASCHFIQESVESFFDYVLMLFSLGHCNL